MTAGPLAAEERVHLDVVNRIKNEAFQNSKVMDHMFQLTDVNGPRLTGSPGYRRAAEWVVKRLTEAGVSGARLEKWGPFGKGWSFSRFSAHMIEPSYQTIIGFPLAWTPGTNGVLVAEPVMAVIRTAADFPKWQGKLRDKIVLIDAPRELKPHEKAALSRYTNDQLSDVFLAPDPAQRGPVRSGTGTPTRSAEEARAYRAKLHTFLKEEGVALVLSAGYAGDGGTVFASSGGTREAKDPVPPPMAAITPEHYNRIARLLDQKVPVKLEFHIEAAFDEQGQDSWNVVGEIPGGKRKDEVVMLGAHLDSWHGGTGATDNAAGSAVMIEAMRILKALNLPLDRTVRIGLWSGEEQGLLGSRAYVKEHFADRETMKTTEEHKRFAAYYNIDNGTGKIRGIYLQGNDMARPIFESWLSPFKDLGATTVSIRNTGGTDHLSFDGVGLPGFQFIQDSVEYGTRTHHSNMDVYDRIQAGDMMQMSAIVASFVYHTAMREELIPRKPLPKPAPRRAEDAKPAPSGGQ
ncbi:MAG: M20/M25/M40 family metallo-hydrolase [Acidobacteria bacterium]|nr:M20/M25/M40 family metallo-hydrolase [Acidobacteriota bacterium]